MDDSISKKIFYCTFISIILIVLTPLSNLGFISTFIKMFVLVLLGYTLLLNISQLRNLNIYKSNNKSSPQITSQIQMNLIGSYIFMLFLGLLFYFIITSFF
jgi:hypothetical protein